MSKTIDERVVKLEFDNSNFEANVKTSLETTEKLKDSMKFETSSKGLEQVAKSVKNIDMKGLGDDVVTVRKEFSLLETVTEQVIRNITNKVVDAGLKMAKALTLDGITSGFSEYETKLESVQTIMANTASKGTTIEQVTEALDELNQYADLTIYNFAEMTKNIGTFTAAGVDLETSVSAIQGIANLAATSGSTSQQASTAMYQLSQAIAAGTVKLQDWNSVVNAGMGGETFQNALKETAKECGVAVDEIIEDAGSFRESLSEGWVTADILNTTLKKFTTDGAKEYAESMLEAGKYTQEQADALVEQAQVMEDAATKVKTFTQLLDTLKESIGSGWAQTWELIFGDFYTARDYWTSISDTLNDFIGGISDARNAIIEMAFSSPWEKLSGYVEDTGVSITDFQDKIIEVGKEYGVITDQMISDAGGFEESLSSGWASADIVTEALSRMTGATEEYSASTEDMSDKLAYFQDIVDRVWSGEFKNAPERYQLLAEAGYDYAKVQALVNKTVDGHRLTLDDLSESEAKAIGYTEEEIEALKDLQKQAEETGTPINDLINSLGKKSGRELFFDTISTTLKNIINIIKQVGNAWNRVFNSNSTSNVIYKIITAFNSLAHALTLNESALSLINSVFTVLFSTIKLVGNFVGGAFKAAFEALSGVFSNVNIDISGFTDKLAEGAEAYAKWVDETDIFQTVFDAIKNVITEVVDKIKEFVDMISESEKTAKVLEVIQTGMEKVYDAASDLGNVAYGRFGNFIDALQQMQSLNPENIASGLKSLGKTLSGSISSFFEGSSFEGIGANIVQGLVNGITGNLGSVIDGTAAIAEKVISTICGLLGIHSPSTVTYEFGMDTVQGFINGIKDALPGIGDALATVGQKVIDLFQEITLSDIFSVATAVVLYKFTDRILNLATTISKPVTAVANVIQAAADILTEVKNNISRAFTGIVNVCNAFATNLRAQAFSSVMKSFTAAIVALVAAVVILGKMDKDELEQAVKTLAIVMGLFTAMVAIIEGVAAYASKNAAAGISFAGMGAAIAAMALVLLAFGHVVKVIGELEPAQATQGVYACVALMIAMGVLLISMATLAKNANGDASVIAKASASFLLMAAALGIMAVIIKVLGTMEWSELGRAAVGLVSMVAVFTVLTLVSNLASKANFGSFSTSLIKMAAALAIMAIVVKLLGSLSADEIANASMALVGFMGILTYMTIISNLARRGNIEHLGSAMTGMGAALILMSVAVKILGTMEVEDIVKGEAALYAMTGVLAIMVAITNLAPKQAIAKLTATLTAMSTCFAVMAAMVVVLGLIPEENLKKGLAAITVIGLILSAMMAMAQYAKGEKTTILALTGVITAMTIALVALSLIDPADLERATTCMGIIMALFIAIEVASKYAAKASAGLLIMLAVVAGLAGILYAMAALDVESSIENAASLAILMVSMIAVMAAMEKVTKFKVNKSSMISLAATFGTLLGVMAALGLILAMMSKMNVQNAIVNATALSELLVVMAGVSVVLNTFGKSDIKGMSGTLVMLGSLTAVVAILAQVLGAMEGMNIENGIANATALSILLGTFAAITVVLGKFKTSFAVAAEGAAAISVVAGIITAAITAIGAAFEHWDNLDSKLDKGIEVLKKVATGLGEALGGFISGALGAIFAQLETWGNQLIVFGTQVQVFAAQMAAVGANSGALEGIATIGTMFKDIAKADLMSAIADFIRLPWEEGTDLGTMAAQLKEFADALQGFSIDDAAIESATKVATVLKTLTEAQAEIQGQGGIKSAWSGDTTLSTFATDLASFAETLASVTWPTPEQLKPETIQNVVNAVKPLSELQGSLDGLGGWADKIGGDDSLATFGTDIAMFMVQLGIVAAVIKGNEDLSSLSSDSFQGIVDAVKPLVELQNSLEPIGGVISWFTGRDDLATFGESFSSFCTSLVSACTVLKDEKSAWDPALIGQVTEATTPLVELSNKLEEVDGGIIFNHNKLTDFGDGVEDIGEAMSKFSSSLSGKDSTFDSQAVNTAIKAINQMAELNNVTLNTDNLSAAATAIGDFATQIKDAFSNLDGINADNINAVANGLTSISTVNSAGITATATALQQLAGLDFSTFTSTIAEAGPALQSAATQMMNSFTTGISNGMSEAASTVTAKVSEIVSALQTGIPQFSSAGSEMMANFSSGLSDNAGQPVQTVQGVLTTMQTTLNTAIPRMRTLGGQLMQGLANGITDKASTAAQAAAQAVAQVRDAAAAAAEVNSPSRVFKRLGDYLMQGLALGIDKNSYKAEDSGIESAKAVISAFQNTLGIHSPSTVAKDEVGRYIVEGIAEGITEDMTAEEAAEQKAQNIIDAFQDAIDEAELTDTIANLEYKFWQAINPDLGDEYNGAQKTYLETSMESQKKQLELAYAEYKTMLGNFGADNEKTLEAYQSYLQLATNYADTINSYNELIGGDGADAWLYLKNNLDYLIGKYKTNDLDTIWEKVKDKFNYSDDDDIDWQTVTHTAYLNATELISEVMNGVKTEVDDAAASLSSGVISTFGDVGTDVAKGIAGGVTSETGTVETAAEDVAEAGAIAAEEVASSYKSAGEAAGEAYAEGLSSQQKEIQAIVEAWTAMGNELKTAGDYAEITTKLMSNSGSGSKSYSYTEEQQEAISKIMSEQGISSDSVAFSIYQASKETGEAASEGYADGVSSGSKKIKSAVTNKIVNTTTKSIKDGLSIASPSKVTMRLGRYTVEGFAKGISQSGSSVEDAAVTTVGIFQEMADQLDAIMDGMYDIQPTISPTVDLRSVQESANEIGLMLGAGNSTRISAVTGNRINSSLNATKVAQPIGSNGTAAGVAYNFTQNNYSPKALSRQEIYRQTKNQFATLKSR